MPDSLWSDLIANLKRDVSPRLEAVAERAADHFGLLQKARLWRAKNILEDLGPDFFWAFLEELGTEVRGMGGEHVAALQLMMTGPGPGAGQEAGAGEQEKTSGTTEQVK